MRDQPVDVQALFDAKAPNWQAKYEAGGALVYRSGRFSRALADLAPPPATVLDFGCGTGDLARSLAQHGYRVIGCDFAPEMLGRARAASPAMQMDWVLLHPDWSELPFHSGDFDAIVASSVFEYLEHPKRVISECARILRVGGVILCTVPDRSHPVRRFESLISAGAHLPIVWGLLRSIPRSRAYVNYLQASRNRLSIDQWRLQFESNGLRMIDLGSSSDKKDPLVMMAFRKLS